MPHASRQDYNEYIRNYLKRRYDERRGQAIRLLGGQCVVCGATDELEFDHIDHSQKSFDVADRLAQYTWERLLAELVKCQLLCFRCHIDKSSMERCGRPANQHGTRSMYRKGCRCEPCRQANNKQHADYYSRQRAGTGAVASQSTADRRWAP